jgi:energy-coupling factor transport system permease protein
MNNISFGQYIPGNSWIYKLDPRTKIILSFLMIVLIFLIPNLYGMLIALGVFLIIFFTTRIPFVKVLKGLKPIMFLLLFTFILQLIYTKGTEETLLYSFNLQIGLTQIAIIVAVLVIYFTSKKYVPFGLIYLLVLLSGAFVSMWLLRVDYLSITTFNFDIYTEGLSKALFVLIRITIMIGTTSLLTLSTMTTDINNGIEAVLKPLKYIGIPVGVFSMLISLTLRFIPTLLGESKKIMNAQASRGVDFAEGNLKEKVTQIISLLIPMFVISFKRAEDLADAMEARGYVIGAKRTKLDELKLRFGDYLSFVIMAIFFAAVIWSRFYV